MRLYIGIDPGLSGAIAVIDENAVILALHDTPVILTGKGRHDFDLLAMANLLWSWVDGANWPQVAIEKVGAMPGQGIASTCKFCKGAGFWEGMVVGMKLSYTLVHPVTWKKFMMRDMGKEKEASMIRAKQLFPTAALTLKKHHGRADALLLAEYLRRTSWWVR